MELDNARAGADTRFFGHPVGLATLFFTEMFERFSYYGMRALLILYMTHKVVEGGLGFKDAKAGSIYGLYTAMVYLLCLAGGWIADTFVGQRRAVLVGGILISGGEFCLLVPGELPFYAGLVLLMMGTGLLKGNVSTIVGQLYPPGDKRRDSGFSIFYMGINTGAVVAPLICGWIGQHFGYRLGFGVAGLGMVVGVSQYMAFGRYLGTAGLHPAGSGSPELDRRKRNRGLLAALAVVALLCAFAALGSAGAIAITPELISNVLGCFLLLISVVVFSWLIFGKGWTPEERKRSTAVLVLFVSSAVFWAALEQAGSSLNLFADRSTHCVILGFAFPSSWFQLVEPVCVVLLAPLFAWLWLAMAHRDPSAPAKFSMALVFNAVSFAILIPAAAIAGGGTKVSALFLLGTYFMQALGELSLSPVGLSAMSKLAPARAAGFMMGIWFLSTSIGNFLAGKAASLYSSMPLPSLFGYVAAFSIAAAVVMALLTKPTMRLMSGVK
jgi:POT family proton-dependent oligopeptide transporter